MAFVWKHPNSGYWSACYTTATGQRVKKTTKQIDRKKALAMAVEFERAERLAKSEMLGQIQARKIISEILERTTGEVIHANKTRDYLLGWVESIKVTKADATFIKYRGVIHSFIDHIGDKADKPLEMVRPMDIQRFADTLVSRKRGSRTISNAVKTLSAAFGNAFNKDLIRDNPVRGIAIPRSEPATRGTFTVQQLAKLIEVSDEEWQIMIMVGYSTASRLTDCATMRAEYFDLKNGILKFKPRKTRGEHLVTLSPQVVKFLRPILKKVKTGFICPTLAVTDAGGFSGLSNQFRRIMEKAKVDPGKKDHGFTNEFSALSFHSLRHSFTSELAEANIPQEVRMKLTGHKSVGVHSGYTHHEVKTLRSATNKLPPIPI